MPYLRLITEILRANATWIVRAAIILLLLVHAALLFR